MKDIEQRVSRGITSTVDNFVLQKIVQEVSKLKLKKDDLVSIELHVCPYNGKQIIMIQHEDADEICSLCEKAVDVTLVVFQIEDNEQVWCLESEIEKLLNK